MIYICMYLLGNRSSALVVISRNMHITCRLHARTKEERKMPLCMMYPALEYCTIAVSSIYPNAKREKE